MKKITTVCVLVSLGLTGCTLNKTQEDTLGGAAIGAGVGAVISGATGGKIGTGAAVGAAAGAIGGALMSQ